MLKFKMILLLGVLSTNVGASAVEKYKQKLVAMSDQELFNLAAFNHGITASNPIGKIGTCYIQDARQNSFACKMYAKTKMVGNHNGLPGDKNGVPYGTGCISNTCWGSPNTYNENYPHKPICGAGSSEADLIKYGANMIRNAIKSAKDICGLGQLKLSQKGGSSATDLLEKGNIEFENIFAGGNVKNCWGKGMGQQEKINGEEVAPTVKLDPKVCEFMAHVKFQKEGSQGFVNQKRSSKLQLALGRLKSSDLTRIFNDLYATINASVIKELDSKLSLLQALEKSNLSEAETTEKKNLQADIEKLQVKVRQPTETEFSDALLKEFSKFDRSLAPREATTEAVMAQP
jgi:hypothetical protein